MYCSCRLKHFICFHKFINLMDGKGLINFGSLSKLGIICDLLLCLFSYIIYEYIYIELAGLILKYYYKARLLLLLLT